MKDEVFAHLHDIVQAGNAVKKFVDGRTIDDSAAMQDASGCLETREDADGAGSVSSNRALGGSTPPVSHSSGARPQ